MFLSQSLIDQNQNQNIDETMYKGAGVFEILKKNIVHQNYIG